MTVSGNGAFADRLLAWHDREGRRRLPWQVNRTPYRVWVSEIMLQQTQVVTVIPYFERFMARFPTVEALAAADEDEVLHLWSGLGYYSRGRNLHAAARSIVTNHGGAFPRDIDSWRALPGVGRSTAGAILALSRGARHPILDGNVKRVLSRYHGIAGWPGEGRIEKRLWRLAEAHTPEQRVAAYTQAIMDLGATLCLRRNPRCSACPLVSDCAARRGGRVDAIPAPRPKRERPFRRTRFLVLRDERHAVLLERRPPSGVWGGLWSFPECAMDEDPAKTSAERFGLSATVTRVLSTRQHGFTHFRLEIEPVLMDVIDHGERVMEGGSMLWYKDASPKRLGFAAPVRSIIVDLPPRG